MPRPLLSTSFLNWIRSTAHLPPHTWYYVSAVALSALNRPAEIPVVFGKALSDVGASVGGMRGKSIQDGERLVARRIREGLVKSAAVVGLPKTINALLSLSPTSPSLHSHLPPHLVDSTSTPTTLAQHIYDPSLAQHFPSVHDPDNAPLRDQPSEAPPSDPPHPSRTSDLLHLAPSEILGRGTSLFNKTYGKVAPRVMSQMDRAGTPDLGVLARLMYGHVLSGGWDVLGEKDFSFVLIAGLVPQDVNPQLKGHLRGALNHGATEEEVAAVRDVVVGICEEAGSAWGGEVAKL